MDREQQRPTHFENSPTHEASHGVNPALDRNITAIMERRRQSAAKATTGDKIAAAVSRFAGSMVFVYLHMVLFGGWIIVNLDWVGFVEPFDPSLVVLAMIASVEAIFLSTFVLINQNRMAANDDERADLDLQINLLNEHETTRLIEMVDAIARHLGVQTEADDEVGELTRDVAPEKVLDELQEQRESETGRTAG